MATSAPTSPPAAIDQSSHQSLDSSSRVVIGDTPVRLPVGETAPSSTAPAPTALPIQVSIEVNHLLTLLSALDTSTLSQIIQVLTTVLDQREAQAAATPLEDTLARKTVPELKALAQDLGLSLRSRCKKSEMIAAIVTAQTQPQQRSTLPKPPKSAQLETPERDNRPIWEQLFAEIDALEYSPPDANVQGDPFLQKFRRQGLNV